LNQVTLSLSFAEEGIDTASTRLPAFTLPLNVENLNFIGIGPITARGNSLNNYILTSQAGDAVLGEGGDDTIIAADGAITSMEGPGAISCLVAPAMTLFSVTPGMII